MHCRAMPVVRIMMRQVMGVWSSIPMALDIPSIRAMGTSIRAMGTSNIAMGTSTTRVEHQMPSTEDTPQETHVYSSSRHRNTSNSRGSPAQQQHPCHLQHLCPWL